MWDSGSNLICPARSLFTTGTFLSRTLILYSCQQTVQYAFSLEQKDTGQRPDKVCVTYTVYTHTQMHRAYRVRHAEPGCFNGKPVTLCLVKNTFLFSDACCRTDTWPQVWKLPLLSKNDYQQDTRIIIYIFLQCFDEAEHLELIMNRIKFTAQTEWQVHLFVTCYTVTK